MARPNRFETMIQNKNYIIKKLEELNQNILSINDIGIFFNQEVKNAIGLPQSTTRSEFLSFLIDNEIIREITIKLPNRIMKKYTFGNVSNYEIALSINKNSYLSHYTAMFLHGLTDNVPKVIYTNMEQAKKSVAIPNQILIQENIDRAFSRPMRKTNNIAKLKDFNVILLNGKNVDRLEVINIEINEKKLPITSIERTLIDIVTRPDYSGGTLETLNAYEEARGRFSTGRLIATLNKMNYTYPYHQAIGFYLERAGYDEKILKRFDKLDKQVDFYLTYQMKEKSYSNRWKLYYPSYLD